MVNGLNLHQVKKIETLNPETNKVWATVPEANELMLIKRSKLLKMLLMVLGLIFTQKKEQSF
jgi:hypothetical protein